jgi:hypothetical protein
MCYEERFLLQRAPMKVQKRDEPKSVIDGLRPSAPPDRKPETDKPKEVERELEPV